MVFIDEEILEEKYFEICVCLFASDGYFHMVFTVTLNQDMWRFYMSWFKVVVKTMWK